MRPIDADKIIDKFEEILKNIDVVLGAQNANYKGMVYFVKKLIEYINDLPEVESDDILAKAHWVEGYHVNRDGEEQHYFTCSECYYQIPARYHEESCFCPCCGSRMEDVVLR